MHENIEKTQHYDEMWQIMATNEMEQQSRLKHESAVEFERRNEVFMSEIETMVAKFQQDELRREARWNAERQMIVAWRNAGVVRMQQQESSLSATHEELKRARAAAPLSADEARNLRGSIARYESTYSSVSESLVAERASRLSMSVPTSELASAVTENDVLRRELQNLKVAYDTKAIAQLEEMRRELSALKLDNEQLVHNLTTTVTELDRVRRSKSEERERVPSKRKQGNRRHLLE